MILPSIVPSFFSAAAENGLRFERLSLSSPKETPPADEDIRARLFMDLKWRKCAAVEFSAGRSRIFSHVALATGVLAYNRGRFRAQGYAPFLFVSSSFLFRIFSVSLPTAGIINLRSKPAITFFRVYRFSLFLSFLSFPLCISFTLIAKQTSRFHTR